jgi:hypothetical protein
MDYYNGYTPEERVRKLNALHKHFPNRSHPYYKGPCHMCGDSASPVAPHGEDYSQPYHWERPAVYALCSTCHGRLHKRFKSPHAWEAYKLHLRRGGFGSDLKSPPVARQISKLAKSLAGDAPFPLVALRPTPDRDAWWESLTTNPEALTASWARAR